MSFMQYIQDPIINKTNSSDLFTQGKYHILIITFRNSLAIICNFLNFMTLVYFPRLQA